jgi:hypothetical protein
MYNISLIRIATMNLPLHNEYILIKMLNFFRISIQRVSLWHFHVYMYCVPNWFILFICLLYTLVLFGGLTLVSSAGLKILYSFLYRKYITFFTFFFYSPPPINILPLMWLIFHSCPLLLGVCSLVSGIVLKAVSTIKLHCSIKLHYLNQCKPPPLFFIMIFPYLVLIVFSMCLVSFSYTNVICFIIIS